jgi:hypothetical protein
LPQFKEVEKKSIVITKTSLSLGLSNLNIFPQLAKESEQLPNDMGITILTIDHPMTITSLKRYALKNTNKKFSRSYKETTFGSYVHYV